MDLYEWDNPKWNEWRLIDCAGKIVGRVFSRDGEFHAVSMEKGSLGWYATEAAAKNAVRGHQ